MNKTLQETEKLHESASKLNSRELILGLATVYIKEQEKTLNPKAILILKTYLKRALEKEGIT